ncbi:hypothetical protein [Nocardioides albus]|uniref:Uncharacterized protein n=1 Tax=Nocardioides albus TaxID=1841 RepID=A0A7W5A1K5_9ACTN|nr:hypothetical protein [Nocardioides albus]MBB3087786.1 hypothetical protein [Nocardioides albus]
MEEITAEEIVTGAFLEMSETAKVFGSWRGGGFEQSSKVGLLEELPRTRCDEVEKSTHLPTVLDLRKLDHVAVDQVGDVRIVEAAPAAPLPRDGLRETTAYDPLDIVATGQVGVVADLGVRVEDGVDETIGRVVDLALEHMHP